MLQNAYRVSREFNNAEQQIKNKIPQDQPVVGYAAIGNGRFEPALWLPFGVRRVERVTKSDSPEQLARQGIHYVVIENSPSLNCGIDEWMVRYHASLASELTVQERGHDSSLSHVYIMRLENP